LQLLVGLLRRRYLHQLYLVELVLADQTTDVLTVGPGLAAKAGRVRRVAERQLAAVEDFVAVEIGQRHFRRRHEIQIPIAGDLEEVRLELRQIAGAGQRGGVDEKRRLDLAIAVLARVQIEHEVDERARQPRARAAQHGKARRCDLDRALEIENAERAP